MKVLVTGGAGYIGSHAVRRLEQAGHQVVVLDNLSRGHRASVPSHVPLYPLDLRETSAVATLLGAEGIECVMHFAALTYVGESVEQPLRYYDNNSFGTVSLLSAMQQVGVDRIVFSSTCATYGEPTEVPITEQEKQSPINPYGWSKLFVERMLTDQVCARPSLGFAALRYFNVAGCASDGSLGEHHDPETHLIPVVLQAALGLREKVSVFGNDYPTPDGTCVRDYIHVEDLVDAHIQVMQQLHPGDRRAYNLGIGRGYSVNEVIEAAKKVTGRTFPVEFGPRRPGDPPQLFASPAKAKNELGWHAKITDLEAIIETAWRWFKEHPHGYAK
ncbi:MAG TPA: UDP-glucose 4-epimerase GalE [Polyangiaceae bacterium]|nr:UDP-glucose 4-epimerase GalE [Polyangiaceae bacterium]